MTFLQIPKRFQDSWKSSVAEAESVLAERPKLASTISSSTGDAFQDSSTLEKEDKAHPAFPLSSSPVSSLPETTHITNGSISSPVSSLQMTSPAKPSTLKKSSGKKKQSKPSKDTSSKNYSKKTLSDIPDQSDRDNGECPYSDLDSVPKILCPKALERQHKLVPTQLSVTVVKEVKKQPEIQSGLWFSKSGKDRRPKTTSPMPDRTLFSKLPCKKKNSSVISKKTPVPCVSSYSSGGTSDQSGLSDKHKPLETNLAPEQSGHLKCKNTPAANSIFGTTGSPTDQKSLVSIDSDNSKSRQTVANSADTFTGPLGSSDVKKASEPNVKVNVSDQPKFLESVKCVSPIEDSEKKSTRKVQITDSVPDQEKEINQTLLTSLQTKTDKSLPGIEKQTNLVSKCRIPFVKLVRKDIKDKSFLNSSVCPTDKGVTRTEKTTDADVTKISPKQSHWMEDNAADSSESTKFSVKKLKASGGSGLLHLSTESSHGNETVTSNVSADELCSTEAERIPVSNESPSNVTYSTSNQSDKSEGEEASPSLVTSKSFEHSDSSEPPLTSTTYSTSVLPSHQHESSECSNAIVHEDPSPEISKKAVHKSKQVQEEVLHEQPAHLPASNRLMTRALKAMQEKREKAQKKTKHKQILSPFRKAEDLVWKPDAKLDLCTKKSLKSRYNDNGEFNQDTFSSCSTSPLVFSDSNDFDVKSEDEDLSISSTPPMDFIPLTSRVKAKKEDHSSDMCSLSSPPSPFSFMNAFKNVDEVSFQSVTNESGKPVSFKPDTNYKFSTFLMMLKDLHDTRERDGAPLELDIGPPSAHVKEEPLVMPGEATPAGQDQRNECGLSTSNSSPDKSVVTHTEDGTIQIAKRSYNRRSNSTGGKKKPNRKVPCRPGRSGPGYPGLESPSGMTSLLTMDSSSRVEFPSRVLGSSWERQAGGGEGLVGADEEAEERWRKVKENLQIMVPLEQNECDTTLCGDQPNGLVAHCTNTSLTHNTGGGDKAPTGEELKHKQFCTNTYKMVIQVGLSKEQVETRDL